MERSYKTREQISCGYCGGVFKEKNFKDHLDRKHERKERKYAQSEDHAAQLRLLWMEVKRNKKEEQALAAIQREKEKMLARRQEKQKALTEEKERILNKRKRKEEQEAEEKKKKVERKRKRIASGKKNAGEQDMPQPENSVCTQDPSPTGYQINHDHCNKTPLNSDSQHFSPSGSGQGNSLQMHDKSRSLGRADQESFKPKDFVQNSLACVTNSTFESDNQNNTQTTFSVDINPNSCTETERIISSNSNQRCDDVTSFPSESVMKSRFRSTKSLEDLSHCNPEVFSYDACQRSFQCIPCTKFYNRPSSITHCAKASDTESIQKQKFRDVKKKLLSHMYSSSQHKAATLPSSSPDLPESPCNEFRAGMAVGRAAYGCIKKGSSYKDFETDLCMRYADNLDVGNINHSASFASALTKQFHSELHGRMQKKLNGPLPGTGLPAPFAVVCDKMTPSRTTLHNIGIVAPVDKGRLRATFLEAYPSGDGSGFGMAREIHSALKRVYSADDIRTRFTGAAVDGAYINCNIKEHLLETLGVAEEAKDSYACTWDPAHQLELAGKTSRKQDGSKIGVSWIKDTVGAINHFSSKFGRGKGWKEVQEAHILALEGDSVETKAPRLQNFSATRFTSYAYRAISAVRKNWSNIYNNANLTKTDNSLIKDPKFILRMCGMEDAYHAISKASTYLQSSRIYPWNATECLGNCSESQTQMSSALRSDASESSPLLFPTLSVATVELSSTKTYQAKKLLDTELENSSVGQTHFANEIKQVKEEVAQHLEDFVEELGRRQRDTLEDVTKVSREVFALKKITKREPEDVPSELRQLFLMHKIAGFIPPSENYEKIESQYKVFLQEVHKRNKLEIASPQDFISKEEEIYATILSTTEPSCFFQGISRMLATAISQTHCEAVTEGWGSVLDARVKSKINLDPEKLTQEVFIKLNGPPPSTKCNDIVAGALDRHFGGRNRWHFYRSSRHIEDKSTSVVLNRLSNADEGFPF